MSRYSVLGGCVVGRCWEECPSWVPSNVFIVSPMAHWPDSRLSLYIIIALNRTLKDRQNRARQAGQGSEMRGFLLVPSSSPTLSPIYDGLDVSVTSSDIY